jgi:hypothetical protein
VIVLALLAKDALANKAPWGELLGLWSLGLYWMFSGNHLVKRTTYRKQWSFHFLLSK